MPGQPTLPGPIEQMSGALALMRQALALLDGARAPAHVGAHLDLAIARLCEAIPAPAAEPPGTVTPAGGS